MGTAGECLRVSVLGHTHEVSAALLGRELTRSGPPPRLPLLEAVIRHAPREQAVARLVDMLDHAALPGGPGGEHAAMHAALGLLRLSAGEERAQKVLAAFADRLGGAAGAMVRCGVLLLREGPQPLCQEGVDPLLLRQSPRAICALGAPPLDHLPQLAAVWAEALRRSAKTLGVQAFRAFLGDVAEAVYRMLRMLRTSRTPLPAGAELADADRGFLIDTITIELSGTADFLAARPMVWLLGALGPPDDAGVAAIERARDRFANEAFHADCAAILSGAPWPPA